MRTPQVVQTDRVCQCGRPVVALKGMFMCGESGAHPAFCDLSPTHGLVTGPGLTQLLTDVMGREDS